MFNGGRFRRRVGRRDNFWFGFRDFGDDGVDLGFKVWRCSYFLYYSNFIYFLFGNYLVILLSYCFLGGRFYFSGGGGFIFNVFCILFDNFFFINIIVGI